MALDGHVGPSKQEAADQERECFIEAWVHQAMMAALEEQEDEYPQIEKLADYEGNATFIDAEVKKLDEELEALQEALPDGDLVAQLLVAVRRACQEAIERGDNLYFFGDCTETAA